ncbi:RNA exonuclease 3 [Erysiphe neolycopersici]|uniref:RNA exonuclease 3 n=1 Tax=Erysiphe neolycopersici TaxID=212602 RepID=A0A420HVI6_9PEZI|nr:RNA exonuclease 3 [Erysiphe neolycopersici]
MFSTKCLFSNVPCPYEESCLLPRCIFKHSDSLSKISLEPSALPVKEEKELNTYEPCISAIPHVLPPDSSPNTKSDSLTQTSRTGAADNLNLAKPNSLGKLNDQVKKRKAEASSIVDDISSPAQRRKTVDDKPALVNMRLSTGSKSSISAHLNGLKNTVLQQATKVISQEALNPRALKASAPATHNMRYQLLKALHGQFKRLNTELATDKKNSQAKLVLSDQALITRALDIEEETAIVSPLVYSNLIKNKILVYKRMSAKQWAEERANEILQAQKEIEAQSFSSNIAMNGGKPNEALKPIETGLSPEEELKLLPELKIDFTKSFDHGFVTIPPTADEIELARKGTEASKGWEVCDRCKSRFQVFPGRREEDGALTSGGQCTYHYGRTYLTDLSASFSKRIKKYRCCGESLGDSHGCTTAPCHVFKISEVKRLASILNFQTTPPNFDEAKTKQPVCLDGEMGYTVNGLELIRLTATSWPDGQDLFDVLVRPLGPILDLNSRYSGVYPEHMANALPWTPNQPLPKNSKPHLLPILPSVVEARSLLFSHLSPSTPLIGHGLENDLNAIRMIHPTIIDTAFLFPHKLGLPYRNSLKSLVRKYLDRAIQDAGTNGGGNDNNSLAGHDSKEDAIAAGDLVKYALKIRKEKLRST